MPAWSRMWRRSTAVSASSSPGGRPPTRSACSNSWPSVAAIGGNTGQMLLRFLGFDGFVTSKDVVACLRDAGLDVAEEVKSRRDLKLVQDQFNAWAEETGLPYVHLSRICALSIGESHSADEASG